MKTVIFQNINNYQIVIGFSEPVIDPVRTKKRITNLLLSTEEAKKVSSELEGIEKLTKRIQEAIRLGVIALKSNNQKQVQLKENEYKECQAEIQKSTENLKVYNRDLEFKKIELMKSESIYFEPKPNEIIITDEEYELYKSLTPGEYQQLTIEKKVIPDYRGVTFWLRKDKWYKRSYKLGETPEQGAKKESDMTSTEQEKLKAQFENERIQKLSSTEKEAEKEKLLSSLLQQATVIRLQLEIQGETDALGKSKEWYANQASSLEERYK